MRSSLGQLFKQFVSVSKLVVDGQRDPEVVSTVLQGIINTPNARSKQRHLEDEGEPLAKLFKQLATLGKLVVDGQRDPEVIIALLQEAIKGKASDLRVDHFKHQGSLDTKQATVCFEEAIDLLLAPISQLPLSEELCQQLSEKGIEVIGDFLSLTEERLIQLVSLTISERDVLKVQLARAGLSLGVFLSGRQTFAFCKVKEWERKRTEREAQELEARRKAQPSEQEFAKYFVSADIVTRFLKVRCKFCGEEFEYFPSFDGHRHVDCGQCRPEKPSMLSSPHRATPRSEAEYHGGRFYSGEW